MAQLFGMDVVFTTNAVRRFQYRFPRSKRERIRRKWSKRELNFKTEPCAYLIANQYLVHPCFKSRLGELPIARGVKGCKP